MENESISASSTTETEQSRKGSKKSAVWNHFIRTECGDKSKVSATCMYCQKNYEKLYGTSNLWAHLNNQCLNYPNQFKRKRKSELKDNDTEDMFSQEEARKELAKMLIIDELPFRTVEGRGFRSYSNYLESRFVVPSRTTVARDCLKIYEEEKIKLRSVLRSQRVCLTTDTWTSIQNLNYMCLTAHWIDDEWKLHKRILNFCLVPNHRGETIGKMVESCLLDWEIDNIFTLTVDNASSNDGAIRYLKRETMDWKGTILGHEFMHVRCCAHILNLVVKEGLEDVHESIVKIRNAIRYVRSSPARAQTFKMCVDKVKVEHKGLLCHDIETRWNSTYKMLEVAEKFEKAFARLCDDDKTNYLSYFDKSKNIGPPMKEDWDVARIFVKFLKLFYVVTLKFSGSLYVTSNDFFHELMALVDRLNTLIKSHDHFLSAIATQMKKKLDKYWENESNLNFILFVAVVLDPRFKLAYVGFCFDEVYGEFKGKMMKDKVEDTLNRLYAHYFSYESSGIGVHSSSQVSDEIEEIEEDPVVSFQQKFSRHRKGVEKLERKSEVARYLSKSYEEIEGKFDVLEWWKNNVSKFPTLSRVARDVLAFPVSTVASESAFSTGGRILDPFRSSLSALNVEALVCCHNWLRSTPISIDLREAMDFVETYEELESEFVNLCSPSIVE